MSSSFESRGPCLERAGFLFAHDCPRPATQQCVRCFKAICAEHGHTADEQVLCTECFRASLRGSGEEVPSRRPPSLRDLSPLLFSSYYYRGYGYYGRGAWGHELLNDPNDFTEADGASLRQPAEALHFEEDMQGS